MTHDPMTVNQFRWFLTLVTGGVSAIWFLSDARKLWKLRTADRSDPSVRDRRFGYAIGLVIATIGMVGSAKLQGWISWGSEVETRSFTPTVTSKPDFMTNLFVISKDESSAELAKVVATAIGIGADVKAANMRIDDEGVVHRGADVTSLHVVGVTPQRVQELARYVKYGAMRPDTASDPTIEIGTMLADRLGVKVGDPIDVELANAHHSIRVAAVHDIPAGDLDFTGFMNLATAQAVISAKASSSVEIALDHDDPDHRVAKLLQQKLGAGHRVIDWCLFAHHLVCDWSL